MKFLQKLKNFFTNKNFKFWVVPTKQGGRFGINWRF